jgi:hypothetical protein
MKQQGYMQEELPETLHSPGGNSRIWTREEKL